MNLRIGKSWRQRVSGWKDTEIEGKEYAWIAIKTVGIIGITAGLFYRSAWAILPLLPVGIWQMKMMKADVRRKKKAEFQGQFKDAILAISSALNTGYSVENAIKEAQKELKLIYPEKARISKELLIMVRQLRMQMPMEQVWEEFAVRMPMEDVKNFVEVFVAAKRSGGDMMSIIQNTANQIRDKIDVKREIDTILAAKKYEFRVMAVIPYAIIGYMSVSFPEFMERLYGNVIGIGVMTVCLTIYWGAYYLGMKIVEIEI
jgi:tight adherence protein B